jgi:zinc/manganese transport system permease protein
VGQILLVNYRDILPIGLVSLAALALWPLLRVGERPLVFYLVFAVMVTASVQLVGVYLVFASLIFPALAVQRLPGRKSLVVGYLLGGIGYLSGLTASAALDLPSGSLIVLALALASLAVQVLPMPHRAHP